MRALGYFRYRDDLASPEDFETSFHEYCELNLHQPVETFSDNHATGDTAYPGYRRMLDYMRGSGSEFLVVAPDASHLGHDVESVVRTVVELEGTGAKVTCADEMLPDPLQNAFQRLGIRGVSLTHSDRVSMSMRSRALLGQGLGRPPYGYRNGEQGTLEVVSEEAAVVELIYRLYTSQGLGLRLVVQHLNERKIPTRRGGKWNMVTIRDLLRNPTYMGTYTRFGMRRLKSHEAIIPPRTFRATQDATRLRRRADGLKWPNASTSWTAAVPAGLTDGVPTATPRSASRPRNRRNSNSSPRFVEPTHPATVTRSATVVDTIVR